ncbi:metal ABC transporter permease [Epibacterium ulvae]|uniref:metal ABC transporter permease n=1 Tax=Epibacterium ulvae TaxID=1156985 RepID=UPI0024934AAB|nr:metal ABC transporter permease [Epibacterium ulvae]
MLFDALLVQLGYNATLVSIGAALLGGAAGITGTFLFLRKRALVSDAVSHATLPGVCLAFLLMVSLGGDGRNLTGLLLGSAVSAAAGLWCMNWLTQRTRLAEDAAIGAVLSVFFGFGVVLLTVIQTLGVGRQAGLEGFLLGSTAGMLFADALVIAAGGTATLFVILLARRALTLVAFDPDFAQTQGLPVGRIDMLMMGLVMAVTVVGLKIVGLILIVALLIIPAVTARFWSERSEQVVALAGLFGAGAAYVGAALSASAPNLPTGPLIVLVSFAFFALSLICAPQRGVLAAVVQRRRFQRRVHLRQGLLALAQNQPIYEALTLRLLRQAGLARADGVATDAGKARAAKALRDEKRWEFVRRDPANETAAALYDGLRAIETVLTADQIAEIDRQIGGPQEVLL